MADGELARVFVGEPVARHLGARELESLVKQPVDHGLEARVELGVAAFARDGGDEVEVGGHDGEGLQEQRIREHVARVLRFPRRVGVHERLLQAGDQLVLELLERVELVDEVQVKGAAVHACPPREVAYREGVETFLNDELGERLSNLRARPGVPARLVPVVADIHGN